jgi:hypothetical protein
MDREDGNHDKVVPLKATPTKKITRAAVAWTGPVLEPELQPPPSRRGRPRFVLGPIPLGVIFACARSGHPRAMEVWLILKMTTNSTRQPWVRPPLRMLEVLGLHNRMARSRVMRALERVGLIERRAVPGGTSLARLVPWQDEPPTGDGDDEYGR